MWWARWAVPFHGSSARVEPPLETLSQCHDSFSCLHPLRLPDVALFQRELSISTLIFMADPLSILGGVGSILQIITHVTKLAKSLNEVRESYQNVSLNITLVASQLSTIRAALEALHTWRNSDTIETEASIQLDQDLGLSLSCCAILITVIDGKLTEAGYKPGLGMKQKIKYLWLEDTLKEYVSNLEGQVRALQLLLTIFQCRTATEQKQQLAKAESRSVIAQVRAETMTLGVGETEIDDAMSILSHDPSVHFDVDSIIMQSPAYKRVYGEVSVHSVYS